MNGEPVPMVPVASGVHVAICVPSGDHVCKGFAMSLAWLMRFSAIDPHDVSLIGVEGSSISINRNNAVREAQRLGCTHVFFLDSDMLFPPHALRRLLAHDKDVVGCIYLTREEPRRVLGKWKPGTQIDTDGLKDVEALPAGCLLIRTSVFDKMVRPYFRTPAHEATAEAPEWIQGEDYYFCEQAKAAGFSIWLDLGLSIELGHIGRQVSQLQVVSSAPKEVPNGQAASVH